MEPLDTIAKQETPSTLNEVRDKIGILLIVVGAIFLVDFYLKTGWLPLLIVPVIGLLLLAGSFRYHNWGLMIAGSIVCGVGTGLFVGLSNLFRLGVEKRIGAGILVFGLSWALIAALSYRMAQHFAWWALFPAAVIGGTGAAFLVSPLRLVDFVLAIVTLLGLAFLAWGLVERLFGLIIPGSLLAGVGPGIFVAWGPSGMGNGLARTGIMLVSFALGWALITLFSRRVTNQFVWWPLIPAGVLAMVGWGLYIGGNPTNAVVFIGNTGSIALILFGIYLLLLRRGISH